MSTWWLGLPPTQTDVQCGGRSHRLRWDAGEVRALDHDDAEAERTLAALGGQRCACVDTLDAWARHATDEQVLVLASRGPMDPVTVDPDMTASLQFPSGWTAYAPLAGVAQAHAAAEAVAPEDELIALLGLGGGLPERLVATVAAAWAGRLERADDAACQALPALRAALYGRALAALRTWLGRPDLDLDLHMADASATATLTPAGAGRVRAELPFAWLMSVWSRGLTTVLNRFCLTANTDDGRRWTLETVGPDLGPAETVTVELGTRR